MKIQGFFRLGHSASRTPSSARPSSRSARTRSAANPSVSDAATRAAASVGTRARRATSKHCAAAVDIAPLPMGQASTATSKLPLPTSPHPPTPRVPPPLFSPSSHLGAISRSASTEASYAQMMSVGRNSATRVRLGDHGLTRGIWAAFFFLVATTAAARGRRTVVAAPSPLPFISPMLLPLSPLLLPPLPPASPLLPSYSST
mmetsp:Transcript_24272/g.60294  ORF Transcript_24272/g.60294 Transcript_24272/m.60294 type:complete len:202 (-) Transcript_24272:219-824(-)